MITCRCPNCRQKIEADMSFAGESVNCPTCRQKFIVPDPNKEPYGSCPACKKPLRIPEPVICVYCGHRFRRTAFDPEEAAKRRRVRRGILATLGGCAAVAALGTLFFWLLLPPGAFGWILIMIAAGTLPGLGAAMLAKLIRLRASPRTGGLACLFVLLIVFSLYGVGAWSRFDRQESAAMVEAILRDPDRAGEYPPSPARNEMEARSRALRRNDPDRRVEADRFAAERIRLTEQYPALKFPFRWKLNTLLHRQSDDWTSVLAWLAALNFFNLLLAYSFGQIPGAFSRLSGGRLRWDDDIPAEGGTAGETLLLLDSPSAVTLAVVGLNSLAAGLFAAAAWIVAAESGLWKLLLLLPLLLLVSLPALSRIRKCPRGRARVALIVCAAVCFGAMTTLLYLLAAP